MKALDNALRALALASSHPLTVSPSHQAPLRLRLVGPDQAGHMAELMSLCESLHLPYTKPGEDPSTLHLQPTPTPKQVQFIGPKFGSDLAAEYENCDCAILASHTENFGATIVDAMAHGKPVIAGTKTPWRIVAEEGCGWWVDNDPAILSKAMAEMMALSDDARAAMGRKGRQLVEEKYAWPAVGKSMLAEYEKLLKGE